MHYFAFVQRDESGDYLATLPDLPGCTARATSWLQLDPAIRGAVRNYVTLHARPAPPPTPIEDFSEDSAPANSCWMEVALFAHELQPPVRGTRRRVAPRSQDAARAPRTDLRSGDALAASP